ncbi:MAG: GDSL-type esterase/lipase family protein, partial [Nocardioides sp.]
RGPRHMELVDSPPITIVIDDLGIAMKSIEIWLPHNGFAEVCAVRVPTGSIVTQPEPKSVRWVHYGSSISHCVESRRPTETWPAVVARRHGLDLLNLGLAGHCHLDQLVARDIREAAPDLISLKLGVNVVNHDSFRERTFVPALHGFLDTLRDRLADVPVLVLTSIICPPAETVPGPTLPNELGGYDAAPRHPDLATGSLSVQRIRELVTTVVSARIQDGDTHLSLGDGLRLFGPDDVAELHDNLHPTPEGYLRIADRFSDLTFGPDGCWAGHLTAEKGRVGAS